MRATVKTLIGITAALLFAFMIWRVSDRARFSDFQESVREHVAVKKQTASPAPAPPKFTPAVRPDNTWDREARKELEAIDKQEPTTMAAIDSIGPKIGPPETVETLKRWYVEFFKLKRAIYSEPAYSDRDLDERLEKMHRIARAQQKAEMALLGVEGWNRYQFFRTRTQQGVPVTEQDYERHINPPKGAVVYKTPGSRLSPVDTREFDQYFTQR